MSADRDSFHAFFGFVEKSAEAQACFRPAIALALTMALLPFLLHLPIDTDRAIPLFLLPAIWLAWKLTRPITRFDYGLLVWTLVAMISSALCSAHVARALVMTSAVIWTIAGALTARKLATSWPAVRLGLIGMLAGAVIGVVMVRWGVGAQSMFFPTYWSARLFGGHQFVGCLAGLGLLIIPPEKYRLKPLVILATAIAFTGLAWSGSRAPVAGLAVFIGLWFWKGSSNDRRALWIWVPLLSVAGLVFSYPLGQPYPQLGWWDAFQRTVHASGVESISSDRSKFWQVVWNHIGQSPWIGHGADGYRFIHPSQNGNQPHNMLLQWLLEFGLFGAIPIILGLIRGLAPLQQARVSPEPTAGQSGNIWAAAALAGALIYGCFDGVFYHMVIFMPVAVIAGFAWGRRPLPMNHAPIGWVDRGRGLFGYILVAAASLLVLHNWLYLKLLKDHTVQPQSIPAKILRGFPSVTYGLQNWTEAWRPTRPELAMAWIKWAQTVSTEQNIFHAHAAQIYLYEKNFEAAEAELWQCLHKGPAVEQDDILKLISQVQASAQARKAAASVPVHPPQPAAAAPSADDR